MSALVSTQMTVTVSVPQQMRKRGLKRALAAAAALQAVNGKSNTQQIKVKQRLGGQMKTTEWRASASRSARG